MRYHDWKTVCVGRYLIDIPISSVIKSEYYINNNRFRKLDSTVKSIQEVVREKIATLKNTKHDSMGNMFIRDIKLPNGVVLIQSWDFKDFIETSTLYIYIPIRENKNIQIYYHEVPLSMDREKMVLDRYTQIASSLRAIPPGTIPRESGYCMDDVILLDTPGWRKEYGWISPDLPDAPFLLIKMLTHTLIDEPKPLRANELKKQCAQLPSETCTALRNNPHSVGPLPGYEICVAGIEPSARYRIFSYLWYSPGERGAADNPNNNNPGIMLTMGYARLPYEGMQGPRPFFSDEESLAMWDRLVNSIRFRPVG